MDIFSVGQVKIKALRSRMSRLGIKEGDIQESFIRSSGPGGQNVNKVSSSVYLKHLPTGIEVKCSSQRSQAMNRFMARRILASRVEEMVFGAVSEERRRIEKIRRQKRKRSKRAREKVLAAKKRQAEKKAMRRTVDSGDYYG